MNSLRIEFNGSLVRRLSLLFILLGLVPMLVLSIVPTYLQAIFNQQAAADSRQHIQRRAELDLNQMALTHAMHYDTIFRSKADTTRMLAQYTGRALEQESVADNIASFTDLILQDGGWRVVDASVPVGFLVSPLAVLNEEFYYRQTILQKINNVLQAVVDTDSLIRSAFYLTEDQTIWLYPNLFWENDKFTLPASLEKDLTNRPYYNETTDVVWTNPYIDQETVITVAAPIYVHGSFYGMAGLDFRLATLEEDILQTNVGELGYMFLMHRDGELINMPQKASQSILNPRYTKEHNEFLGHTIYEVVTPEVNSQLQALDISTKLETSPSYVALLETNMGATYFAFARLNNAPWYVVLVEPVDEITQPANQLVERLELMNQRLFWLSIVTGLGFVLIVLIGGFITLRKLALPIQALVDGAERVGQGDLNYHIQVPPGDDEMNRLTRTFNAMVTSVRETLETSQREFNAINQIAELANRQSDMQAILGDALQIARQSAGVEYLGLSLLRQDGSLTLFTSADDDEERSRWRDVFSKPPFSEVIHQVIASRRPYVLDDTIPMQAKVSESDTGTSADMHHKCIVLPVISKDKIIGTLSACMIWESGVAEQKQMFLDAVSNQLATLVENIRLQRQARDLVAFEERCRLARDLHDSVTQSLFSISLTVEGLKHTCQGNELAQPVLKDLATQISNVKREMRSLINELHPLDVEDGDLERNLRVRAASFQRTSGVQTTVSVQGNPQRIPAVLRQNLSRIAQEALSNIAKHADATEVSIHLDVQPLLVQLIISDNGTGFDPAMVAQRKNSSLGLISMRERAELLDGSLQIRAAVGEGTTVIATMPLENENE